MNGRSNMGPVFVHEQDCPVGSLPEVRFEFQIETYAAFKGALAHFRFERLRFLSPVRQPDLYDWFAQSSLRCRRKAI